MVELVEWLRAQLDEDGRIAREAGGLPWSRPEDPGDPAAIRDTEQERVVCDEGWPSEGQTVHIAEWDPARVLREIDAARQRVAIHAGPHECASYDPVSKEINSCQWVGEGEACTTLRLETLPYVDRPGYREEWRP